MPFGSLKRRHDFSLRCLWLGTTWQWRMGMLGSCSMQVQHSDHTLPLIQLLPRHFPLMTNSRRSVQRTRTAALRSSLQVVRGQTCCVRCERQVPWGKHFGPAHLSARHMRRRCKHVGAAAHGRSESCHGNQGLCRGRAPFGSRLHRLSHRAHISLAHVHMTTNHHAEAVSELLHAVVRVKVDMVVCH